MPSYNQLTFNGDITTWPNEYPSSGVFYTVDTSASAENSGFMIHKPTYRETEGTSTHIIMPPSEILLPLNKGERALALLFEAWVVSVTDFTNVAQLSDISMFTLNEQRNAAPQGIGGVFCFSLVAISTLSIMSELEGFPLIVTCLVVRTNYRGVSERIGIEVVERKAWDAINPKQTWICIV